MIGTVEVEIEFEVEFEIVSRYFGTTYGVDEQTSAEDEGAMDESMSGARGRGKVSMVRGRRRATRVAFKFFQGFAMPHSTASVGCSGMDTHTVGTLTVEGVSRRVQVNNPTNAQRGARSPLARAVEVPCRRAAGASAACLGDPCMEHLSGRELLT